MSDDDPFDVFSDDDEEDDENMDQQMEETESRRIASALLAQANSKKSVGASTTGTASTTPQASMETAEDTSHADLSYLERMKIDWPEPLFLGPVVLVSSLPVGGGRGYVATQTLPPGTLVLVEELAVEWPQEQIGRELDLISVSHILEHSNAKSIVHDMEEFHPTKQHVDQNNLEGENEEQIVSMMNVLRGSTETVEVEKLVDLAKSKGVTSKDGTELQSTDILRLLLAIRYNGIESGIYRHVAMLNHDCYPNCTKFRPEGESHFSEVRTTRRVEAGESLTISYVPRVMSHASRRRYLWDQHRFDIGANLKGTQQKVELIGNSFPPSNIQKWDEESPTRRVEKTTVELEQMLHELQEQIEDEGDDQPNNWETLKALEQSTLELFNESLEQLQNSSHLLLIPILRSHIETCALLGKAPRLSTTVQLGILSRQVLSCHRLLPLSKMMLGPDHFDMATTHLDFSNGVSELLSRDPSKLYELSLASLSNFAQWTALERNSRQEYHRIKALYPRDAEQRIASNK
eukprot:Nitzschia sp. Nitz4//scaffold122_size67431//46036//47592//NITZ4_006090-RA/size67431-processed-gene-0.45-mRNA-1//-1//CDS//3329534418//2918//frame0